MRAYLISQIASAIVAFVSSVIALVALIFLVKQTTRLTRYQKTSQYQAAVQLMFDWRSDLIRYPELAQGLKDIDYFQRVFKEHKVRPYFHTMKMFSIFEVFFILQKEGIIDEKMWESWKKNVTLLVKSKDYHYFWEAVKSQETLNEDFKIEMQKLIDDGQVDKSKQSREATESHASLPKPKGGRVQKRK